MIREETAKRWRERTLAQAKEIGAPWPLELSPSAGAALLELLEMVDELMKRVEALEEEVPDA